jgi:hypothetical protein
MVRRSWKHKIHSWGCEHENWGMLEAMRLGDNQGGVKIGKRAGHGAQWNP